jgi:hypothetical protein
MYGRQSLAQTWKYQGEKIEESEWRSVKNDQIVLEPAVLVWGSAIYNRVLTPRRDRKTFSRGDTEATSRIIVGSYGNLQTMFVSREKKSSGGEPTTRISVVDEQPVHKMRVYGSRASLRKR